MKYKVELVEVKNKDWYQVSLSKEGVTIDNVSVNRADNKGRLFPNFDGIMTGCEVEGELWESKMGKHYLYPPKPTSVANQGNGGAYRGNPTFKSDQIKKTAFEIQQNVSENVAKAQDRSAWMYAKNGAVELLKGRDWTVEDINDLATKIYNLEPITPFND
jgi:hypothetical protein